MRHRATVGGPPVHHQIADSIRSRIDSGDLSPGDTIPTIRDIREQWRCATTTAQQALSVLRNEGRITGGRGKPAIVRQPPRRIRLTQGERQALKDLVGEPEAVRASTGASERLLGVPISETDFRPHYDFVNADERMAEDFCLEPGTELLRRTYETVDQETGHTLLCSESYIPTNLISGNEDLFDVAHEPWPGGHQHQLYTVGIEIDRFEDSVAATAPTLDERNKWGIEEGVPMLRLMSRSIDTEDRIVEISKSFYPADRAELFFTEKLRRW